MLFCFVLVFGGRWKMRFPGSRRGARRIPRASGGSPAMTYSLLRRGTTTTHGENACPLLRCREIRLLRPRAPKRRLMECVTRVPEPAVFTRSFSFFLLLSDVRWVRGLSRGESENHALGRSRVAIASTLLLFFCFFLWQFFAVSRAWLRTSVSLQRT